MRLADSVPSSTNELLSLRRRDLDAFVQPSTVALIGATDTAGSVGRTLLWNLISSPFGGTVFPVNPKRKGVLGVPTYPNIAAIPGSVDLAVIATPASSPSVISECVQAGVKAAIVISAGFREVGASGLKLEQEILEARR